MMRLAAIVALASALALPAFADDTAPGPQSHQPMPSGPQAPQLPQMHQPPEGPHGPLAHLSESGFVPIRIETEADFNRIVATIQAKVDEDSAMLKLLHLLEDTARAKK